MLHVSNPGLGPLGQPHKESACRFFPTPPGLAAARAAGREERRPRARPTHPLPHALPGRGGGSAVPQQVVARDVRAPPPGAGSGARPRPARTRGHLPRPLLTPPALGCLAVAVGRGGRGAGSGCHWPSGPRRSPPPPHDRSSPPSLARSHPPLPAFLVAALRGGCPP